MLFEISNLALTLWAFCIMAVLLVKSGKHFGKVIQLSEAPLRIGRDQSAEIRIPSTEVSRLHCEIVMQETSLLVKDLGSKNGTLINGTPVFNEILLEEGDYIQVGPMTFEFLLKKPKKVTEEKGASNESMIANWLNQPNAEELLSDTTIISRSTSIQTVQAPIKPKHTPHEVPQMNHQSEPEANNSSLPKSPVDPYILDDHVGEAAEIILSYWQNLRS